MVTIFGLNPCCAACDQNVAKSGGIMLPVTISAPAALKAGCAAREARHLIQVPPGKQLVIECLKARLMSAPAFLPRGKVVLVVNTRSLAQDKMHCFRFVPPEVDSSRPDPNVFRKTHFFTDPGSNLELVFIREAEKDAHSISVTVLGTLISLPATVAR